MMLFVSWFCGILGTGIIMFWIIMLLIGQIQERKTEPLRLVFHILAEIITGIVLILSALSLIVIGTIVKPLFFFSMGMLIYTLLASPGYFAHKRKWIIVALFFFIFLTTLLCIYIMI